jgi:hypothetical protein
MGVAKVAMTSPNRDPVIFTSVVPKKTEEVLPYAICLMVIDGH